MDLGLAGMDDEIRGLTGCWNTGSERQRDDLLNR